MTVTLYISII